MKKTVFLLVLMLATSSCSFVIGGSYPSTPGSTHIPSIDKGEDVFPTLQGTIWKKDSLSDKDTYLYIDEYERKYAIKSEKKGVRPEEYPAYYEYTELNREQDIPSASPLKLYNTVIFNKANNDKNFIGFYLENSFLLYSAESTGNTTAVVEGLEQKIGDEWKLYGY